MDRLNKSDLDIIRESIIEALTLRSDCMCTKCGEIVKIDQLYQIRNVVGDFGDHIGYVIEHIDCTNPSSTFNPTMSQNVSPDGRETKLQRELMKDGPSLNRDE